jgi:hypothetical protein
MCGIELTSNRNRENQGDKSKRSKGRLARHASIPICPGAFSSLLCRLFDIVLKLIEPPISSAIPNANFIGYWVQRSLTFSPRGECDLVWFGD